MLNYHELTMNEPRDSPQRRKQFLVICTIMFVMFLHSALDAGVFASLDITGGIFPGGEFVYKSMTKDYAASAGTLRTVASDLGHAEHQELPSDMADLLYSVFLDDPSLLPGGQTRFAGGVLLSKSMSGERRKQIKMSLLDTANRDIADRINFSTGEGGTTAHSKDVQYEVGTLPNVAAALTSHPFTGGAWSALLQSYKILPKLREYAKNHGEAGKNPIVIATCSTEQNMCTYYMPLSKRDKFYMGKTTMEIHAKKFENNGSMMHNMGLDVTFGNGWRGIQKALGIGTSPHNKKSDEL